MGKEIKLRINACYGDLRPSEKRAADYVLKHLDELKTLTLDKLAKNAGVSQPTVMRMIKALGYGGYKEFRYAVVEKLAAGSTNTAGFEEYGITPSFDEVREPMGMLKKDHIRTMMNMDRIRCEWKRIYGRDFTEDDVEEVYQTSEKSILKIVHKFADPKPFVIDTVGYLRDHGIKIGSTTGYTDEMMDIVVPEAAKKGYSPDCWFSPNSVGNFGRPYPYMIFENLKALQVSSVSAAIKIGDTVADIKEGLSARMLSLGIIEGSSVLGLTEAEYAALSPDERSILCDKARDKFLAAGASAVLNNLSELPRYLDEL